MLPSTRRPSATTCGSASKFESRSTSCATARVASLPEPIAMPMSASFSASASLTPSPVMPTVWPRERSALTIARFCCGVTRPNTDAALDGVGERAFVLGQIAGVDRAVRALQPELPGDRAHGPRIVARDHLHRDVLLAEVRERRRRVRSHRVLQHHERRRPERAGSSPSCGSPSARARTRTRAPSAGGVGHAAARRVVRRRSGRRRRRRTRTRDRRTTRRSISAPRRTAPTRSPTSRSAPSGIAPPIAVIVAFGMFVGGRDRRERVVDARSPRRAARRRRPRACPR